MMPRRFTNFFFSFVFGEASKQAEIFIFQLSHMGKGNTFFFYFPYFFSIRVGFSKDNQAENIFPR